jgi:hypothetical protein
MILTNRYYTSFTHERWKTKKEKKKEKKKNKKRKRNAKENK